MENYNYKYFLNSILEKRFTKPEILKDEDPFKGENIWKTNMSEFNFSERGLGKELERCRSILINVLSDLKSEFTLQSKSLDCPRLFISHKMKDEDYALRIAHLASKAGFLYWIDVLDTDLKNVPVIIKNDPILSSIFTACIIEMALINCTHVIACMTPKTKRSQWVPYEYGRITEIPKNYKRAAAWIHPKLRRIPEYHYLGLVHDKEDKIEKWLTEERIKFDNCNKKIDIFYPSKNEPLP